MAPRSAAIVNEHPMGSPRLYDGIGSLISYENGECTLSVIVENAWQRFWTEETSLTLVVWNDGTVSQLYRQHVVNRERPQRTLILMQEE